jgi:intracellular sulfur oxidation DsrE/DsrF family protein
LTYRPLNALRNNLAAKAIAAALFCLPVSQTPAFAQALPVPDAGTMKDFPEAHELPDPKLDYKIVFNIETMAPSPDQVSPALKMIGTLINTYEKHGVSPSHMHLVAVFHGPGIALVTDDATYKGRTGVDHNPNVEILQQLKSAGLQPVICGQSAMAQHYDFKSILPLAQINYSASVTFINLMTRGYIRMNE